MRRLLKETFIFIVLFLLLALGMHMKHWIAHPIELLQQLSSSKFGLFHPLYFTFGVYILLYIPRVLVGFVVHVFSKKTGVNIPFHP